MSVSTPRVDAQTFRRVMGSFATGVTVVTTRAGDEFHGMTANSLTSVSLDPLLILVCFARDSRTASAVLEAGMYAVNLLSHAQIGVSNVFARPGEDHFERVPVDVSANGLPLLRGSLGYLECTVDAVHEGGDHVIVVGAVVDCAVRDGQPLVFAGGKYVRAISFDDVPVADWWG
jgi:flavin reductase (DIM6/NTAB) family NADH-FMN oxidoreductase RutF